MNTEILTDEDLFMQNYDQMPEERKKKIDRFKFHKDQRLSLGAGILLKKGLDDLGLEDEKIAYSKNGKPFIQDKSDVFFNISHSESMAVCAFSDRPVGVDIEKSVDFDELMVTQIFNSGEVKQSLSKYKDKSAGYTFLWTVKESFVKYLGIGLELSPKNICVDIGSEICVSCKGIDCANLHFYTIETGNYVLTVCSEYESFTDRVEWINKFSCRKRGSWSWRRKPCVRYIL